MTSADNHLDLSVYAAALEDWLVSEPETVVAAASPHPRFEERVEVMSALMDVLYAEGWSRYGWPEEVGGLGGTIVHRAAMWAALARHGVQSMAIYEHLEVLAPVLVARGPRAFLREVFPRYLRGREPWAQGFSEPGAGSDLASLRTRAVAVGDDFAVTGRKIWTSWARYARWALVLARTGAPESRHRGLTAFIVDLRSPGVEVNAIEQANGTDELAEVAFDEVHVPGDRVVGEVDGGWQVAMHILSHERGTYPWFRHGFLERELRAALSGARPEHDRALGEAILDLTAVRAAGVLAVDAHARDTPLGPRAAFTKLALCGAEKAIQDWVFANDPELAVGPRSDEAAMQRQEYLFSRIVTIYGGSEQMQLETIAKQVLRLP